MKSVHELVLDARNRLGMSQLQFAKAVSLSPNTLWRIESKRAVLRKNTEDHIRKAVASLLSGQPAPKNTNKPRRLIRLINKPVIDAKLPLFNPFYGKDLAKYRELLGLNQTQLAKKTNFSATTICFWESGRQYPTQTSIARLQQYFNSYVIEDAKKETTQSEFVQEVPDLNPIKPVNTYRRVLVEHPVSDYILADDLSLDKFYGVNYLGVKAIVVCSNYGAGPFRALLPKDFTTGNYLIPFGGNSLKEFAISISKTPDSEMIQFDTLKGLTDWVNG